jgi:hypothetical protein
VKLMSECMATNAFSEAPEFILRDLAADGLPLARELRAKLNTTALDANGTEKAVADMLVGIAAEFRAKLNTTPAADAASDLESGFMLRTVFQCTMFGVVYGRFTALRLGVTEDKAVDGMVTAYASSALDGLIAFLAELPQPEAQPTPPQPETQPPQPPPDASPPSGQNGL